MQNKGIVIVTAVLLTLASIFYLSFSFATRYYDSKAEAIKDPIAQQDYKDSVKYLGIYSYQKCLETQIGLGLDLKGGMNVILEISVPDVLETLADHKTDAFFVKAMEEAKKEEETKEGRERGKEDVIVMGQSEGWYSYPSKVWSWQVTLENARRVPSEFLAKNKGWNVS